MTVKIKRELPEALSTMPAKELQANLVAMQRLKATIKTALDTQQTGPLKDAAALMETLIAATDPVQFSALHDHVFMENTE